jgi:putative endonuclease
MEAAWSVYILRCGDGSLYTGATNDVDRRVARHAAGKGAAYTRSRLPVMLVFQEPAQDKSAALRREAQIKKLSREKKLRLLGASGPTRGRGRGRSAAPR